MTLLSIALPWALASTSQDTADLRGPCQAESFHRLTKPSKASVRLRGVLWGIHVATELPSPNLHEACFHHTALPSTTPCGKTGTDQEAVTRHSHTRSISRTASAAEDVSLPEDGSHSPTCEITKPPSLLASLSTFLASRISSI